MPHVPVIYPDDDLLSVAEAAHVIGTTQYDVRGACHRGDLPARTVPGYGNRLVIRRADAEALRRRRTGSAPIAGE